MGKADDNAGIVPVISEYDKLIEEILELELKLAALAEEIDDLENHICVELRADCRFREPLPTDSVAL